MQMLYQGASTPFTRNLYSQKLQQINCVRLRTMMTNSNPLSNIWTMGRTDRWGTYVRRRSVFPQWQWHFIQTIICREEKCHSIASTKNSANRALTLVPWPLHELSVTLAWIKCMNAWDPHTFGTMCLQTYDDGSNPAFPVPRRNGMFTTQNHLCSLLPFLVYGKLLLQTVWALFLSQT